MPSKHLHIVTYCALVLSGCTDKAPPPTLAAEQSPMAQCGKDTDCKGARICDAGVCKILPVAAAQPIDAKEAISSPPVQEQAEEPRAQRTSVKQPKNWGVQYQDASCIVLTDSPGAGDDAPWLIKMGYLHGNQLNFIFSAANSGLKGFVIPENPVGWLTVDGKDFSSHGISNQDGELVLQVENGMKLQAALANAKNLGIVIQRDQSTDRVNVMDFNLYNIPGAVEWLKTCSLIGVGALPK